MNKPLNQYIDYTMLKPDATEAEIRQLCKECIQQQYAAACVQPTWVKMAREILNGSTVKLCTVVGFPLGANTIETKAQEAAELVASGADEIDMVINIAAVKAHDYQKVRQEIEAVVQSSKPAIVKVILETCLLTDEEKRTAAKIAVDAGASYVKTSTGFAKSGATVHDVAILREAVGPDFGVKASGGIRDLPTALTMIEAGASRIGTSTSLIHLK
jgi:deoxyribose-phosphate aldolase